jgi:hypothetical protein
VKKVMVALVTLVVAASAISAGASAATYKKWRRSHAHATYYPNAQRYRDNDDSIGGYYEHRLDAVRFGSQRWWKIYDEQNGGSQHR